ncbi:hypothetical protein A9R01_01720 ['Osedax' symbiont bacterium Rs2_46_30_T18]|nr:hypothetical protein A9R01_01720 ['Osedax' symbiont bacterium Rs2_46_30_T18]
MRGALKIKSGVGLLHLLLILPPIAILRSKIVAIRVILKRRLEQIDKCLDKYMTKLEETDQLESAGINLQTVKI